MATKSLSSQAAKGNPLPEWQKERIEMASKVQKRVLDPFMIFAQLIKGYNRRKGDMETAELSITEISVVLRLLVIGGHMELRSHCVGNGGEDFVPSDYLETILEEWAKDIKKLAEGEA